MKNPTGSEQTYKHVCRSLGPKNILILITVIIITITISIVSAPLKISTVSVFVFGCKTRRAPRSF